MSLLKNYENLKAKHQEASDKLKKQFDLFGVFRLLLILGILAIIYFLIVQPFSYLLISILVVCIVSFFFVLNFHVNIKFQLGISNELIKINKDEISLLNGENVSLENGERFLDSKHLYAYDLDIFGHKSLYQYLNRTATFLGENKLADLLSRNSKETGIEYYLLFILCVFFGYSFYRKATEKQLTEIKSKFEIEQNRKLINNYCAEKGFEKYRNSINIIIYNSENDLSFNSNYKISRIFLLDNHSIYITMIKENHKLNIPVLFSQIFLRKDIEKIVQK